MAKWSNLCPRTVFVLPPSSLTQNCAPNILKSCTGRNTLTKACAVKFLPVAPKGKLWQKNRSLWRLHFFVLVCQILTSYTIDKKLEINIFLDIGLIYRLEKRLRLENFEYLSMVYEDTIIWFAWVNLVDLWRLSHVAVTLNSPCDV